MAKKKKSNKPTVKERKRELDKEIKSVEKEEEKAVDKKLTKTEKKQIKEKNKAIKKDNKKSEKDKKVLEKKAKKAVVGKASMKQELKKVTWPTGMELVKSTSAVIFIVVLTAVIIFFSDLLFGTLNKEFANQIKSKSSIVETEEDEQDEIEDESDDLEPIEVNSEEES